MAALLVALSVMAVLASAAMPVWKHLAQREKEEELVFRGKQYARAIGLFQRKMGPGVNPPTLDVLVEQRFLRKKYKDPITGDDFEPIAASANQAATPGTLPGGAPTGGTPPPGIAPAARGRGAAQPATGAGTGRGFGGIVGVMSKSKAESIRIYNGRTHYNEWQFVYIPQTTTPGIAAPGGRGQRGGPSGPQGPGGIGTPGRRGGPGDINRGNQPPFGPARGTPMPQQPPPGD